MNNDHVIRVDNERQRLPAELVAAVLGKTPDEAQQYRHPTPTDPDVIDYVLNAYSRPDEVVLDPTCGVGTIVKAAILAGRNGYGSDIVEEYVRLGNADIEQATGLRNRIHVHSALQLSEAAWLNEAGPVNLCFFSPALMNVNRPNYPLHSDQLGNYRAAEQDRWLGSVRQIMAEVQKVLHEQGIMVVNTRNQQADGFLLPNVHRIVTEALDLGFRQLAENIVLFPADPARWPEYLLVFQKQA